jgi:hypothetical protein
MKDLVCYVFRGLGSMMNGRDLEGLDRGLIELLSQNYP